MTDPLAPISNAPEITIISNDDKKRLLEEEEEKKRLAASAGKALNLDSIVESQGKQLKKYETKDPDVVHYKSDPKQESGYVIETQKDGKFTFTLKPDPNADENLITQIKLPSKDGKDPEILLFSNKTGKLINHQPGKGESRLDPEYRKQIIASIKPKSIQIEPEKPQIKTEEPAVQKKKEPIPEAIPNKDAAATKIQTAFRGNLAKKSKANLLQDKEKQIKDTAEKLSIDVAKQLFGNDYAKNTGNLFGEGRVGDQKAIAVVLTEALKKLKELKTSDLNAIANNQEKFSEAIVTKIKDPRKKYTKPTAASMFTGSGIQLDQDTFKHDNNRTIQDIKEAITKQLDTLKPKQEITAPEAKQDIQISNTREITPPKIDIAPVILQKDGTKEVTTTKVEEKAVAEATKQEAVVESKYPRLVLDPKSLEGLSVEDLQKKQESLKTLQEQVDTKREELLSKKMPEGAVEQNISLNLLSKDKLEGLGIALEKPAPAAKKTFVLPPKPSDLSKPANEMPVLSGVSSKNIVEKPWISEAVKHEKLDTAMMFINKLANDKSSNGPTQDEKNSAVSKGIVQLIDNIEKQNTTAKEALNEKAATEKKYQEIRALPANDQKIKAEIAKLPEKRNEGLTAKEAAQLDRQAAINALCAKEKEETKAATENYQAQASKLKESVKTLEKITEPAGNISKNIQFTPEVATKILKLNNLSEISAQDSSKLITNVKINGLKHSAAEKAKTTDNKKTSTKAPAVKINPLVDKPPQLSASVNEQIKKYKDTALAAEALPKGDEKSDKNLEADLARETALKHMFGELVPHAVKLKQLNESPPKETRTNESLPKETRTNDLDKYIEASLKHHISNMLTDKEKADEKTAAIITKSALAKFKEEINDPINKEAYASKETELTAQKAEMKQALNVLGIKEDLVINEREITVSKKPTIEIPNRTKKLEEAAKALGIKTDLTLVNNDNIKPEERAEINKAIKKAKFEAHPDRKKTGSVEKFNEVSKHLEVLKEYLPKLLDPEQIQEKVKNAPTLAIENAPAPTKKAEVREGPTDEQVRRAILAEENVAKRQQVPSEISIPKAELKPAMLMIEDVKAELTPPKMDVTIDNSIKKPAPQEIITSIPPTIDIAPILQKEKSNEVSTPKVEEIKIPEVKTVAEEKNQEVKTPSPNDLPVTSEKLAEDLSKQVNKDLFKGTPSGNDQEIIKETLKLILQDAGEERLQLINKDQKQFSQAIAKAMEEHTEKTQTGSIQLKKYVGDRDDFQEIMSIVQAIDNQLSQQENPLIAAIKERPHIEIKPEEAEDKFNRARQASVKTEAPKIETTANEAAEKIQAAFRINQDRKAVIGAQNVKEIQSLLRNKELTQKDKDRISDLIKNTDAKTLNTPVKGENGKMEPLIVAAVKAEKKHVVNELINKPGIDLNQKSSAGHTALDYANELVKIHEKLKKMENESIPKGIYKSEINSINDQNSANANIIKQILEEKNAETRKASPSPELIKNALQDKSNQAPTSGAVPKSTALQVAQKNSQIGF